MPCSWTTGIGTQETQVSRIHPDAAGIVQNAERDSDDRQGWPGQLQNRRGCWAWIKSTHLNFTVARGFRPTEHSLQGEAS